MFRQAIILEFEDNAGSTAAVQLGLATMAHALTGRAAVPPSTSGRDLRLAAVGTLKQYFKALEYEYRVKTAVLDTLKRYSIISLTLYLE
jgi:hypothetical protein